MQHRNNLYLNQAQDCKILHIFPLYFRISLYLIEFATSTKAESSNSNIEVQKITQQKNNKAGRDVRRYGPEKSYRQNFNLCQNISSRITMALACNLGSSRNFADMGTIN